ncbi:MAG: PKD domain-containing protein [Bacteroidota bacterium]
MKNFFLSVTKILSAALFFFTSTLTAATYTVTSTTNGTTTDGVSLRWAITQANTAAGNIIAFNISGVAPHTISLSSALPNLTKDNTTIDGTTQPANGYTGASPKIIIDGNNLISRGIEAGANKDGIKIYGLYIKRFNQYAIYLPGNENHIIGDINKGNVISDNGNGSASDAGIFIKGGTIRGNIIGMTPSGNSDKANEGYGIYVNGGLAVIGGSVSGEGNIISANTKDGIYLVSAHNTIIEGNTIGTNKDGTADFGNGGSGIYMLNSNGVKIGGGGAGEGNLISGNNANGIYNEDGNNVVIRGNKIGTDVTGTIAIGNTSNGIAMISSANSGTIGGGNAGQGNLISGNGGNGIHFSNPDNAIIKGNKIGTDITGTANIGNSGYGIFITGNSNSNNIGGAGATDGNIIAYNGNSGVGIDGLFTINTYSNNITRNSLFCNAAAGNTLGISLINNGNNGVATPVITTVNSTTVNGTSEANAIIEIFKDNDNCSSCQGKTYFGTTTANASGNWSFAGSFCGETITATATTTTKGTSQFASCVSLPQVISNAGADHTIISGGSVMIGGSPTASGGTAPYTYSWSPAIGLNSSTISNPIADPVTSTLYTLTVTDTKGCFSTDTIFVTVSVDAIMPPFCGIDSILINDTGFFQRNAQLEIDLQNYIATRTQATLFTIPVVVHVIHNSAAAYGTGGNISFQQIQSQMDALNAAFQRDYAEYNQQLHGTKAENTQIKFCLATIPAGVASWAVNPNTGVEECGVMRYPIGPGYIDGQIYNTANNDASAQLLVNRTHGTPGLFPFNEYLNIWVVQDITGGTMGYATMPVSSFPLDGIVIRADIFGDNTTGNNFMLHPDFRQGKVLAHEAGHYLQLFHTFDDMFNLNVTGCYGDLSGNCATAGDGCCDTPPTRIDTPNRFPGCAVADNTCTETYNGGLNDQEENYMTYSQDICMNTFTADQIMRMEFALVGPRFNLWTDENLAATGTTPNGLQCSCERLVANIIYGPQNPCPGTTINFLTPKGPGLSAITWTWDFGDGSPTSNVFNPSHIYTSNGVYTVTLTAFDGLGNLVQDFITITVGPTAFIGVPNAVATCRGATANIFIQFTGTPPFSATLTNGLTNYNVNLPFTVHPGSPNPTIPDMSIAMEVVVDPLNPTFTLLNVQDANCPGIGSGQVTFTVVDCCNNIVTDGNFATGTTTNFTSDLTLNCNTTGNGDYCIDNFFGPLPFPQLPDMGNSMFVDGPTAETNTGPPLNSNIWCQDIDVTNGTDYVINFLISGGNDPRFFIPLELQLSVNGTFLPNTLPPIPFVYFNSWVQQTIVWTSTVTGTVNFCFNQVNNFGGTAYDYLLDNISVRPLNNNTTVNAGPDVIICSGASTQLNALGSAVVTTYSWTPATGLSNPNIANPTAQLVVSTNYTVTVSSAAGCTASDEVFVDVAAPFVSAGADVTINSGQSAQIGSNIGDAGCNPTWLPATNLSCTNCLDPIATPPVTTTYTVTCTTPQGCTATDAVTVTVIPPQCNLSPIHYTVTNGQNSSTVFGLDPGYPIIVGKNITITGTLNINSNITFSGCNIIMILGAGTTGAAINLTSGNLTLAAQTHIYSCTSMWDGIYVPSGRTLTINGSSFIEDAVNAVVSTGGGTFTINTAIFNKNIIAVDVRIFGGTHTGTIVNSIVTSRALPIFVNPASNQTVNALKTTNPLTTYTASNLKAPFNDRKGCYGINATSVTNINIGLDNTTTSLNIFDAIMCGVNLFRSNAVIYNNRFQYLLGTPGNVSLGCEAGPDPQNPPPCYYEDGVGIQAGGSPSGLYSITVGGSGNLRQPNTFYNTHRAISVVNYKTNNIIGNSIDNASTGPFGTKQQPILNYGKQGIFVRPASNNSIRIELQSLIRNCETAIWVNRNNNNALKTTSFIISNNGNVNVNPSTPCITADVNGYCTNGILVTDLVTGTTVTPSQWSIHQNTITETANCINLLNVKNPGGVAYGVTANSCTVRYTSANKNTNGIITKGCEKIYIIQNHTKYNNIGGTAYTSGSNLKSHGIYLQKSTNMLVKCNQIDDAARSMVFEGTCTSPYTTLNGIAGIYANTMHRAQDGFVLLNSGIVGSQGNSFITSNNFWDMSPAGAPHFSRSQTMAEVSDAINSKLYVTDNTVGVQATRPLANFQIGGNEYLLNTNLFSVTGEPPSACGTVPAILSNVSDNRSVDSSTIAYANELRAMVEDTTQLPVYSDASHWQRKYFVFNELRDNPDLIIDSVLQNFYDTNVNTAYGQFSSVKDEISNENYIAASSINNSVVPSNIIEQNQQTINELILRILIDTNYVYSTADSNQLNNISLQCPLEAGDGVYQARNLLMTITNDVIEFIDNCEEAPDRSMQTKVNERASEDKLFNLYPNPNNGNMVLKYILAASEKGTIAIYDIRGTLISYYGFNNTNNQLIINNDQLDNGVYFYHIQVNSRTVKSDKIVIIK